MQGDVRSNKALKST